MDNMNGRLIKLHGSNNFEIGEMHGVLLKNAIKKNIDFYLKTFNQPEETIHLLADGFAKKIESFDKNYIEEINGIAKGAEVPVWQIHMLNARSEIFSTFKKQGQNKGITECTLLFFPENAIMAENWDWALEISKQTYIFEIKISEKNTILTLSEAGILAKIGLNDKGFGIGMNYLEPTITPTGIPIHIIIRKALEQTSFEAAKKIFKEFGTGISGNICLGNKDGEYVGFEFDAENIYEINSYKGESYYCHTNHYLGKEDSNNKVTLEEAKTSTATRFLQAEKTFKEKKVKITEEEAKEILSNKDHQEFPILVPQTKSESLGEIGTIASIILSLKDKKMSVRFILDNFKENYNFYL